MDRNRHGVWLVSMLAMCLLLSLRVSSHAGMGMSFGGWTPPPPPAPELIITPGPIASPMRIAAAPNGVFFISNYQGQEIVSINRGTPDTPESVIMIEGYPLGLVYTKKFLIVGNDSTKTIDVYHTITGKKIKSFATEEPIQASDLAATLVQRGGAAEY